MNIELRAEQTTAMRVSDRPTVLRAGLEPFSEFNAKLDAIDVALVRLGKLCGESAAQSVARLRKQLADFEPSVTMIGQVKSGKTTLVNAMAGWSDLLPADVNPWTSVITSLHLSPEDKCEATGARFQFFDEDEWDRLVTKGGRLGELADRASFGNELETIRAQIEDMREKSRARLGKKFELLLGQTHDYGYFDKNLVERYICLGDLFDEENTSPRKDSMGRFADITKSADLFLNSDTLPSKLCIRDTPGVNDTFMMREQITIRAIRESRICVVVLSAHQALSSVDMALIRLISNLKSRDVLIYVNRIDELADPSRQIGEIEQSIRQTLKDQNGPEDVEILFGSAYWASRVLAGDIENITEDSAEALRNRAEGLMSDFNPVHPDPDVVWQLSGLPALYWALSERIAAGVGQDLLTKVSSSATNIANSLRVSDAIVVKGSGTAQKATPQEVMSALDALEAKHYEALQQQLDALAEGFTLRVDRAQNSFIDRAVASLIDHLEVNGIGPVWEYDPTGLRVLLRSAYNVFGARAQSAIAKAYQAVANDVADLYSKSFDDVVDGLEIKSPPVPRISPPIMLGQTIALDLRGGWWTNWWRRKRGFSSYAQNFQELIKAETDGIAGALKVDHPHTVSTDAKEALQEFFAEQRMILTELTSGAVEGDQPSHAEANVTRRDARRENLETTMETLVLCAAANNEGLSRI